MSKRPEYQLASVAELFKTTEEREEDKLERVQIVPAEQIHPYPREPYQVGRATADLAQLMAMRSWPDTGGITVPGSWGFPTGR